MTPVIRLLRLASPALPIGAFAYSGGLEGAIEEGVVTEASARSYLEDLFLLGQARWDGPILWRLLHADAAAWARWNALYLASRETKELRLETLQLGQGLVRLLREMGDLAEAAESSTLPGAWSLAARAWQIAPADALTGWLVAALEGQLAVLQKALPLGQVAAQRLFGALEPTLDRARNLAMTLPDDQLASSLPGLALLSSRHERQYSRLFRS